MLPRIPQLQPLSITCMYAVISLSFLTAVSQLTSLYLWQELPVAEMCHVHALQQLDQLSMSHKGIALTVEPRAVYRQRPCALLLRLSTFVWLEY